MTKPLDGRLALVTGASRGIGRAVALALGEAGAHIVAVAPAKSTDALETLDDELKAKGSAATLVPLDVKDGAGIDRLGAGIFERWGKLDILVANAGILGTLTPLAHIAPKEWDDLIAINLTANWRLIRALDPLLRASDAGRAIFVSSGAADKATPFWGGYAVTKVALEKLAQTYAAETAKTPVRVNIVNPGGTRTRMRQQAFPGEDPDTLPTAQEVARLFVELADPAWDRTGERIDYRDWAAARV